MRLISEVAIAKALLHASAPGDANSQTFDCGKHDTLFALQHKFLKFPSAAN
jgi:hypothetical protein